MHAFDSTLGRDMKSQKSAVLVTAIAMLVLVSGCASQATRVALQRPNVPTNQAFRIPERHALRGAVVVGERLPIARRVPASKVPPRQRAKL